VKRGPVRALLVLLLAVAVLAVAGCSGMGYYMQSIGGQLEVLRARKPIDEVLGDPDSPQALKARLALVLSIREFASRELALPDNGSYRGYADLARPYVVWNVIAAERLSIVPRRWCFPFAGCVGYKGFFAEAEAEAEAAALRAEGNDVFIAGVPAYSTLGWFDDPVLNTFVGYPQAELARLIFHELAHQVVYVRDDSVFNESFAVAVELEGVRRWLARHGTDKDRMAFEASRKRRAEFTALTLKYRKLLAALYASQATEAEKLAGKRETFAALAREYGALKVSWGGFSGYDRWLGPQANNATIASVAIYNQLVPGFQRMLAREGGDLGRFYDAVKALAELPRAERRTQLGGVDAAQDVPDAK